MADNPAPWLLSAAISLTTTKYLLTHNLHFPLRLLFLHLLGALVIKTIRHGFPRLRLSEGKSVDEDARERLTSLAPHMLFSVGIIGSLICTYQALLHFPTLASLVMILTLDWKSALYLVGQLGRARRTCNPALGRNVAFGVGVSMVYLCEFRLMGLGILMSLLSVGFAGLANLSLRWIESGFQGEEEHRASDPLSLASGQVLGTAIATTVFLVWLFEGPSHHIFAFGILDLVVLIVGCATSAIVLESGSHVATRLVPHSQDMPAAFWDSLVGRSIASFTLAGLTSVGATVVPGVSSVASTWQVTGWSLASIALLDPAYVMPAFHSIPTARSDVGEASLLMEQDGSDGVKPHHCNDGLRLILRYSSLILFLVVGVASWSLALSRSHTLVAPTPTLPPPQLDLTFRPSRSFEIVIAQYNKPIGQLIHRLDSLLALPSIQDLEPRIVVYDKLPGRNESALAGEIKANLSTAAEVVAEHLENIGREGDTSLHHMISHWDELAGHTLFIQANMHNAQLCFRRVNDYLRPDTGFLSLQSEVEVCNSCEDCHDRYWSEDPSVLNDLYHLTNDNAECRNVVLTYKGQFITSAARIRGNSKDWYENLLSQLRNPESVLHAPEYTDSVWHRGQPDSLNAPRFGFTLERFWGVMLHCSEPRIARDCPSLLSGVIQPVGKVVPENCQCLDA